MDEMMFFTGDETMGEIEDALDADIESLYTVTVNVPTFEDRISLD